MHPFKSHINSVELVEVDSLAMNSTPDYTALRAQTMGSGNDDEAVTVNTRKTAKVYKDTKRSQKPGALIDKVLARYSGEFTMLRELLQNAADASGQLSKDRRRTWVER